MGKRGRAGQKEKANSRVFSNLGLQPRLHYAPVKDGAGLTEAISPCGSLRSVFFCRGRGKGLFVFAILKKLPLCPTQGKGMRVLN